MPDDLDSTLRQRAELTEHIYSSPYDAIGYLRRSICYLDLELPDLAIGDAYRALLLADELSDETGEYHDQALGTLLVDLEDTTDREVASRAHEVAQYAYKLLIAGLEKCDCHKTAEEFIARQEASLGASASKDVPLDATKRMLALAEEFKSLSLPSSNSTSSQDTNDTGTARREIYPWNTHEPSRYSSENLLHLNHSLSKVAPKLTARISTLPLLSSTGALLPGESKQLGLFANQDIFPGELILHETSLLTAHNRTYEPLCDACAAELPPLKVDEEGFSEEGFNCPDCYCDFCSAKCRDAALESYHSAICDLDVHSVAENTPPAETSDALYFLLLLRTFAMSATQDKHPLDLPETRFLWGEFTATGEGTRTLPFSFKYHVLYPIHVLEKMEIDIYTTLPRYDTWIINTLYAKFRGVASGRVNPRSGKPEVCAVHPLWCLANHSCAPNVRWEWGGEIKFWARRAEEVVRWGDGEDGKDNKKDIQAGEEPKGRWNGGIKKDEEIMNHYCDLDLPVTERREWAKGALGGLCICSRCVWEAGKASNDK